VISWITKMEYKMKRVSLIIIWVFAISLLIGQTYHIQEGFSTTSMPSGWSGDVYFNSNANIGTLSGNNGAGFNASNKYLQTPSMNGVGTLTFWMKGSAAASQISFKVQKSVGGGTFSDLASYPKPNNDMATLRTIEINDASNNIVLKFVAFDRSGNSIYLDDIQVTTYSGGTPEIPSAPVATDASDIYDTGFTANWNTSAGASAYYFDLSQAEDFSSFEGGYEDYYVQATSLTVSGLEPETTYFYRLRAYNSAGSSGNSNTISVQTAVYDPYEGYYASATGLSGIALKNALHNIINSNTNTNYNNAKLQLFQNLDNNSGVVRCVYTGKDYVVASNYNGSTDPNTEHTYAQSWFGSSEESIKKADLHHLFITKMSVNSARGNSPFDEVISITNTYHEANDYYSYLGKNSANKTVFEPADQHKGNLARALLYFSVRYEMTLSQGGVDMLDTLLDWHLADPVDEAEQIRNNKVHIYQGNRNPFVDYPSYAGYIWAGEVPNTTIEFSPASAMVDEDAGSITLTIKITNPSSTATTAQIVLYSGDPADLGNYATQSITFPANSSSNQQITVNITDDLIMEGTENFEFRIINVSGGDQAIPGSYYSFNLTILDNDIPAPVATAASEVDYTAFRVNWEPVNGVEGYLLDISSNDQFSTFLGFYEDFYTEDSHVDVSGLDSGTTYYYRLRALYNEGFSEYSNVISVQTLLLVELTAPIGLAATAVSHEGFTARWNAVLGAESYQIQVFEQAGGFMVDLIISEYVEGTSNNKYIEIYNGTGAGVDLSNYQLLLYSNGSATVSTTTNLSGVLGNGACKVYKNSSAALVLPEGVVAENAAAVNFNGDDAISLYKKSPAGHVDIFGRIGNDPGTAWTAGGGYTTVDRTLVRKDSVTQGITVSPQGTGPSAFSTLSTEWDMYPTDTAEYLGSHAHQGASLLAGYDGVQTTNIALRVSNLQPETQYAFKVRALNFGFTGDYSSAFVIETTEAVSGEGSGTALYGAPTTLVVPVLSGMQNNNLEIDPNVSGNPDFSVVVSSDDEGLYYGINSSDADALNELYTIHHEGLGYVPQSLRYRYGGELFYPASFGLGADSSWLQVSGISGAKGNLSIELMKSDDTLPVELSAFNVALSGINNAQLQWVSQSETNLLGYYIYRNTLSEIASASKQSDLIPATNTSTQQSYIFKDELPHVGDFYYWLEYRNLDGSGGIKGPISLHYEAGEPPAQGVPAINSLNKVFPNPGHAAFVLEYSLAKDNQVQFRIYNMKGQLIRQWTQTGAAGLSLRAVWDAKDSAGLKAPSGTYILKMMVGGDVFMKKLVVMK